jgi:hypothetical protein
VGACAFGSLQAELTISTQEDKKFFYLFFETFFLLIRFIKEYLLFNIGTKRDGEYVKVDKFVLSR